MVEALDSLTFVETNITDLKWEIEDVQLLFQQNSQTSRNIQKSIFALKNKLNQVVRLLRCFFF